MINVAKHHSFFFNFSEASKSSTLLSRFFPLE